ncbi:MAG: T9SS type A sorting domain-containing protein [Bacteroidia bacterium]
MINQTKKSLAVFLLFTLFCKLNAQISSFDNTFNTPFLKYGSGLGPDAEVRTILPLANNKYIIGGWFAYYNGTEVQRIALINEDGELDQTFNAGRGFNGVVQKIVQQPDGKFIVAGDFTTFNNQSANRIVRLNSNGSRDNTFNASANNIIRGLEVLPDGKILIAGWFTQVNGQNINYLARLEPNGDIDTNFYVNLTDNYINTLQVLTNGTFYIGGGFDTVSGFTRKHLARMQSNGLLDTVFNTSNGSNGDITGMLVQPNGKILIGGWFNSYSGFPRSKIARVNSDGSLDTDFIVGDGANSDVNTFAVQSDGKIIIGGFFNVYNGVNRENIARLNENGSLDNSFDIGIGFTQGVLNYVVRVSAFAINSSGNIYVGGDFIRYNGFNKSCLLRLNTNGSFDGEFNPYNGTDGFVNQVALLPDNNYLIAGNFTAYNNVYKRGNMIKLHANGLHNQSLFAVFNQPIKAFVAEPNGLVTAVGNFSWVNGSSANKIVRLFADGSYDSSFNAFDGGFNEMPLAITLLNNKYLIGGISGLYKGRFIGALELINRDGSLDTLFGFHNSVPGTVNCFHKQKDGKILVAGNGFASKIFRLNTDGTLDNNFISPFTALNANITAVTTDTANKILVAITVSGFTRVLRLFENGTVDTDFNSGTGTSGQIFNITVQTDGKILLGGSFTSYNSIFANRIIRLNYDGSYDFNFVSGGGTNGNVRHILFEPNGKLMVAGDFNFLSGRYIGGVGRLINDRIINMTEISGKICGGGKLLVNYNATGSYFNNNRFIVQLSDINGNFTNPTNLGEGFNSGQSSILCNIPINLPASNNYRIRVVSTAPYIISNDNGSNLTFELCPAISITNQLKNSYCQNEALNVTFEAIGTYGNGNLFTVQISDSLGNFSNATNLASFSGSGQSGTIQTIIPVDFAPGNKYRIRVVSTNPVIESINNGFDIAVNLRPNVSIELNGVANFCLGDSSLISASVSSNVKSIIWLYNQNPKSPADTFLSTYAKLSGNYTARVTSVNGCAANSNTVSVNTFQNNLAQIGLNRTQSCLFGNSFTFSDLTLSSNKTGRIWTINNQNFSDSIITRHFNNPGRYVARLVINYNDGCIDTARQEITVHPQTNINISINNANQCLNNNQFIFTDSSTIQSGFYTRLWNFGQSEFYSTPSVQKKYGNIGSFQVRLRTVTDFGCVDSALAVVNINPNPVAKFGYTAVVPCFDNNLFLFRDSSTIQNGSIDHVVWQFPGYPPSLAPNPGITFPAVGLNRVQLVAVSKLGCTDTIVSNINVLPNPQKPYIVYLNGRLETMPGFFYRWYINGVQVNDSNGRFFTPKVPGNYTVRVFNENNCSNISDPFIITNVGISHNYESNFYFSIHPNPASNYFVLNANDIGTVKITDMQGKELMRFEHIEKETIVNTESLQKGMYFIHFANKTKQRSTKIIIQ